MSYLVLARKFRPLTFSQVTGQEHVTRTLANSITRNRVAHAYLFAGPRGVGKTSIARIFAKALNCKSGPTPEPCAECQNCQEIAQGISLAVREIDGASHNSVDNVRDLIDSFRALPPPGWRYKVYIIDEVHMLSTAAFNALLKSLEEPPPNTVFILATTEAHKIPETVISRCQRHDFRSLSFDEVEARLQEIAKAEKFKIEPLAMRSLARLSDGSMRDAQSLLERVAAFCEGAITEAAVSQVLGGVERTTLQSLVEAVFRHDTGASLQVLDSIFSRGVDPSLFLKELVGYVRDIFIAKFGSKDGLERLAVPAAEREILSKLAASVAAPDLQEIMNLTREGADSALRSAYPRYSIEVLTVRLASRQPVEEIGAIIAQLQSGAGSGSGSVSGSGSGPGTGSRPFTPPQRPAAPSSAQPAAKAERPVSAPSAASLPPASGDLNWPQFVQRVIDAGARMLGENLKLLSVSTFAPGQLIGEGPDFLKSLLEGDNRKKLEGLLSEYTGKSQWTITVTAGNTQQGSIAHHESAKKARDVQEKKQEIANHPKIKSLQRVFPGSQIDTIKVKE